MLIVYTGLANSGHAWDKTIKPMHVAISITLVAMDTK